MSGRESLSQPIVAADIVEYNPRRDLANATALVAAKFVKEIAGMMVGRWKRNAQEVFGRDDAPSSTRRVCRWLRRRVRVARVVQRRRGV
jgi:hypothetical protein